MVKPIEIVQKFNQIINSEVEQEIIVQSEDSMRLMSSFLMESKLNSFYPNIESFIDKTDLTDFPVLRLFVIEDYERLILLFKQILYRNKVSQEYKYRNMLTTCQNHIIHTVTYHEGK